MTGQLITKILGVRNDFLLDFGMNRAIKLSKQGGRPSFNISSKYGSVSITDSVTDGKLKKIAGDKCNFITHTSVFNKTYAYV